MDGIRELGFSPYNIRYLLHSHAHIDHIGGTRRLAELTGAKTVIGRADFDAATGKRDLTYAYELGEAFEEPFTPDILLDDGDVLTLGSTAIHCVHTPGHTEGTMSFFFDLVENGQTFHAAMHGGIGCNTMSRAYLERHHLPFSLRDTFLCDLMRLRELPVDVVIGNHQDHCDTLGKYARLQQGYWDAFIDPSEWRRYLDRFRDRLLVQMDQESV